MNTRENNILIAEFLGKKFTDEPDAIDYYDLGAILGIININTFEFHNNWNWIMYTVKKCFSKNEMAFEKETDVLNESLNEVDIESVFNAVVEFIKAYNKLKS